MRSVFITAFEPYDRWKANSSWLSLVQLTQDLPTGLDITTRLYPVNFSTVRERLAEELQADYDVALHLGQAPGSTRIQLEQIAINIGGSSSQSPDQYQMLAEDGPVAYRSELPLGAWAVKLRRAGIPAQISYHAGEYLCNALLYYTHYLIERMDLKTQAAFIHLPLDVSQVAGEIHALSSLPASVSAAAVRLILEELRG